MSEKKENVITFRQYIEPKIKKTVKGLISFLKRKVTIEIAYLVGFFIIGYIFGVLFK